VVGLWQEARVLARSFLLIADNVLDVRNHVLLHASCGVVNEHTRQVGIVTGAFPVPVQNMSTYLSAHSLGK
jgi:hypothetical protein